MDLFARFDPPTPKFVVTETAHPDCAQCRLHAEDAIAIAKVRGSVGGTHSDSRIVDGQEVVHSATVRREDHLHA